MNTPQSKRLVVLDVTIAHERAFQLRRQAGTDVLVLSSTLDPIAQITSAIAQGSPYSEVHLLSHGEPGRLRLGHLTLDRAGLERYAQSIRCWSRHLDGASLVVYGCQVAAAAVGQRFLARLHQLTGAAIAASTRPIGAAALGGTWEFDTHLGTPRYALPAALPALQTYGGLLNEAPTIQASGLPRRTTEDTPLSFTDLAIADLDNQPQSVTLTVTNGSLTLASTLGLNSFSGDGTGTITLAGTLAAVNAAINGLSYAPPVDYSGNASLTITTSDGLSSATRVLAVAVTAVNDEPVVAPTAVTVNEGGNITFAAVNFGISDVDNLANQIIIKLASVPTKGYLTHNGAPVVVGSTFSSDQIAQLRYFHNGTQTTAPGGGSDSFNVSVDDGAGGFVANTTIPIAIAPINQPPALNNSATVFEGQTNYLLPFAIVDPDQTTPYSVELLSLPTDGLLQVNGVAAMVGQLLSAADLATLTYSHNGNDANGGLPPNDGFNLRIIDDGGGTGSPATVNTTYAIRVLPNNDDPALVNNTGITLSGATGRSLVLTAAHLQVSDPDSTVGQLTYTLTAIPSRGLIIKNGAWLPVGASFTQADIDAGRISYLFSENAGPTGTTDSFTFTVRDGELRTWPSLREGGIYADATTSTLLPLTFNITVAATAPPGPGIGGDQSGLPPATTSPPTGAINGGAGITAIGAALNEAGSVVITNAQLSVTDSDSSPEQVTYRLLGLPTSGLLRLNGRALNLYDSFSQADVDSGRLSFEHGGGEIFDDRFRFTLSDGNSVVTNGGNPFEFALTVTPINDQPVAVVSGNPFVKEGESVVIDNTRLRLQDPDGKGALPLTPANPNFAFVNTLEFQVTTLPQYGYLELNGVVVTTATIISEAALNSGQLVYRHSGDEQFSDFFEVRVNDNTAGLGATNFLSTVQRVNIDIATVNDNPFFASAIDLRVAEGEKGTILGFGHAPGVAHLIYNDPDNTSIQRQYRITTNVAYGRLTLNGNRLGVGSVFTQNDLDQGRIEYEHDDSENFSDRFEFGVRDGGGAVVPGAYNIIVDPTVNDAPELTVPTQPQRFDTLAPFVFSTANGNAITLTDPDLLSVDAGEVDFIRITLDLRAGGSTYTASTLTLASTTGLTVVGSNGAAGGILTLAGRLADVQAALNGLAVQVPTDEDRTLQLVVTADDRIDPAQPSLLNNGGRDPVGAAPGYNIVSRTIALNTSNVNDAPTIAAPAAIALNEDGAVVFSGVNAIAIDDLDDFGAPLTVTLAIGASTGGLTLPGATGNGTTTVTLTGTKAEINTALGALVYTPTLDYNGTPTLTITVDDNGNTGGGSQTATATVAIAVNPLNDQPLLTVPGQQTIQTAAPLTFAAGAIAIDDPEDLLYGAADAFSVTVSARRESNGDPFGQLSAIAQGGGAVVGSGTDTLTITGTRAEVNATLNTLSYNPVTFNIDDRIRITVTVNDGNNGAEGTGSVGESTTRSNSFLVDISGVNDPPVLTAPINSLSVNEDSALTFTGVGNVFSFTDSDDFGATNLTATLTVTQGALTLVANDGTTVTGSGTGTLTLVGSKLAINNALDGLIFTPTANYHGAVQLTATINDRGNLGTGGEQTDSETITIAVNPINDRPLASGSITLGTAAEDAAAPGVTLASLVAANNNYNDTTDNQTGLPSGGNTATPLSHVAIVGSTSYVAGQGTWQVSDGSGGWIAIPPTGLSEAAALVFPGDRAIRFVAAPDFHGSPGSLTVRLADSSTALSVSATASNTYNLTTNGGTGITGAWSAAAIPIGIAGVSPVNDAPTILAPATPAILSSVNEDSTNPTGATVTALLGSKYSDIVDNQSGILGGGNTTTALAGIAITANTANSVTQGTWQYNTGSGWVAVPTTGLGDGAALVIPASASLRFLPVTNYNGTPGGLTVRLSDGLGFAAGGSVNISGQIGTTNGWSANTTLLNTAIAPVNDAPLLDSTPALTLGAVNEDSGAPTGAVGVLVSTLTAGISDIDAGAVQGIAVVGIQQGNLWYSTNNGSTWQSAGQPTNPGSLLLAADAQTRLFFRPSANVNGTFDALTIRAWDQTSGTNGSIADTTTNGNTTAFSTATDTIRVIVNPLNDAPTRTAASATLLPAVEDSTTPTVRTIAQLFGGTFNDAVDNQTALGGSAANTLAGVAIVGNSTTPVQGTWQYSTDGATWVNVGMRILGSALRLAADTQMRFLPAANFNGTPGSLTTRLIDSSAGAVVSGVVVNLSSGSATGGTTPYSNSGNAVTLNTSVTAINDAPLATGTATIPTLNEDPASVTSNLVSTLVTANFNDGTDQITTAVSGGSIANPLAGIAIVGNATTTEGTWQYSTDGTTWNAIGAPTPATALLVSASHSLRFVPAPNYNGPVPVLNVHLIDASGAAVTTGTILNLSGGATGGTTAYSAATVPIGGTVNPVNDAPQMIGTVAATFTEGDVAQLVATGLTISDVDAAHFSGGSLTVALGTYIAEDSLALQPQGNGPGQINLVGTTVIYEGSPIGTLAGGNGTNLVVNFTTTSATPAAVKALIERLTYSSTSDDPTLVGSQPTRNLTLTLSDGGNTGSGGPLTAQIGGTITVVAVNDAPVNTVSIAQTLNEDTSLAFNLANGNLLAIGDVDAGGRPVQVTLGVTNGALTLSTTAGLTFSTGDGTADSTLTFQGTIAAINTALAGLVYAPTPNYFGPDTLTLTTNDLGNTGISAFLSDTDTIAITVTPINDPPVATNDTNSISEEAAVPALGNVLPNDSDLENDSLSVAQMQQGATVVNNSAQDIVGSYGTLDWNTDGSYSYSLNNANPAVQALGAGETLSEVFTYTLSDGAGGTDTATLTIIINGTNDAPVVVTAIGNQTNSDADLITLLNVSTYFNEVDATDSLTYAATGLPPGLILNATTGIISGTVDRSASQGGAAGVYSVTVTATDSQNASRSQTFSWTVGNPAPTATNNIGSVTEDGILTSTGNLITSNTGAGVDADLDSDPLTVASINSSAPGPLTGSYGTLIWASNGTYTYSLNNANPTVQALGIGNTLSETFTYVLSDGEGGTDTATLTITINGTNDIPVVVTAIGNQTNSDAELITPLNVSTYFNEVDATDSLTYAATGLPPGLILDINTGIISGTINRSASQNGAAGTYSVTVTATDSQGANVAQTFSWTVGNPAPTATNNVGSVTEDSTLTNTGNLITGNTGAGVDADLDSDPLTVASVNGSATGPAAGSYGSLSWNPDGSYTYSLNNTNPAVQALGAGETLSEVFTYSLSDGEGGTDTATLTITVNGTNDTPVVIAPIANQADDDAETITLNISGNFQDPDGTDILTYTATGLPLGLILDATTGIISGTIDRSASQGGAAGGYSVTITATDTQNASRSQNFSWTVGNPAPTATNNIGSVTEDGTLINTGNLITENTGAGVDADLDSDPLTVASINGSAPGPLTGSYGTLIWASNGTYTYSLNNANLAVQGLTLGQTLTDAFTYTLSDGEGGSDTATLTITVNGTNDAPVLDLDGTQPGSGFSTLYNPTSGPVAIAPPTLTIADIDDPTLASATFTLTNRLNGSDERLVVGTLPSGITASAYDPTTGTLTLKGLASLSAYQTAIAAVAYENTALFPNRQNRTVAITLSDGKDSSNTATTLVQWAGDGINGTDGNDIIYGVNSDGSISGLSNPDIFYGYGGDDIITGGSDTDVIYGGLGNDIISAGGGNDSIYSEAGSDVINGGSGNDYLDGGSGDDSISGGSGHDWLLGGTGNDVLNGGSGNDVLIGGPGSDLLIGGLGNDRFKYQALTDGLDTIRDFEIVRDRIDLSAIGGLGWSNVRLQQSGLNTVLSVSAGGQSHTLATLLDVNANTITSQHFVFTA